MGKVFVTESYLDDIADAIRDKNGTENTYKPSQMAAAIEALPDPSVLDSKSITANGTYDPSDDDLDGYDEVTVNVPNSYAAGDEGKVVSNGALVVQTARSSDITENGTYDTTLNDEVTVAVSGGGGGQSRLPSGYTRLSHVTCDGHTYFNSGILSTVDFGFRVEYVASSSAPKNLFGGFDMTATDAVFAAVTSGGVFSLYTAIGALTEISGIPTYAHVTAIEENLTLKYAKMFESYSTKSAQFYAGAVIIVGSFGDIISGQVVPRDGEFSGSISALEFYKGDQCIANFVPCKNPQNVVGFYDTVRGSFYSSEGSSQFGAGNELPNNT